MPKYKSFGAFSVIISTAFCSIFNSCLLMWLYIFFMRGSYIAGWQSYKIGAIKMRVAHYCPVNGTVVKGTKLRVFYQLHKNRRRGFSPVMAGTKVPLPNGLTLNLVASGQ